MKSKSCFREPVAYAGWILEESIRYNSSSGGIFSALAMEMLKEGGVVYGAAYTDGLSVRHVRVDSVEDFDQLRGSKYVQSHLGDAYAGVVTDLRNGKSVLFSGMPCQTAALNGFVDSSLRAKLWTIDVLCHGVPSQKVWRTYLDGVEKDLGSKVVGCNMRDKSNGWHRFRVRLDLENGGDYTESFHEGVWGPAFYTNLFLRDSCYSCRFKNRVRDADITLGDFWGAAREENLRKYDDGDKGTSVILVNSDKGRELFGKLANCHVEKIPYECLLNGLYVLYKPSDKNYFRTWAFKSLGKMPFKEIVARTMRPGFSDKVKRKIWSLKNS